MNIQTLIVVYLLFAVPLILRSLVLLGANIYRAGQSNSAPPKLFELPNLPRFHFGNGKAAKPARSEAEKLPEV